jgi:hypothetical protein
MGELLWLPTAEAPNDIPDDASRDQLLDSIADASANAYIALLHGDLPEAEAMQDLVESCLERLEEPITSSELRDLYRKSIRIIKEMEKKQWQEL